MLHCSIVYCSASITKLISCIRSSYFRCLTTISRLGRACGIHLIIGVQRPDVNAVPPQIKTNLSYRCCSRADNVLSMIALDNTRAADEIPKDSQGRFIDGEGNVFQAYYLDDNALPNH